MKKISGRLIRKLTEHGGAEKIVGFHKFMLTKQRVLDTNKQCKQCKHCKEYFLKYLIQSYPRIY